MRLFADKSQTIARTRGETNKEKQKKKKEKKKSTMPGLEAK